MQRSFEMILGNFAIP